MLAFREDDQHRRIRARDLLQDSVYQARIAATILAIDSAFAPTVLPITDAAWLPSVKRLGVLAGSFNPPTLAHLALADQARITGNLNALIWLISRTTVDKETVTRAPLASRLAILEALTIARPDEAVALTNRGLYADQAGAIRTALPQLTKLIFIVGFDKIVQIVDPRYYQDRTAALDTLFRQVDMLIAPRDGSREDELTALFARPENQRWASHVHYLPLPPALQTLSSSQVRARIQQGLLINDLVPPEALALVDAGAYQT